MHGGCVSFPSFHIIAHSDGFTGNVYFHLVYRTPTMLQLIPFAAIDCDQTLRITDNYWTDLTVGDIDGDIPLLEDIKLILEIRILPVSYNNASNGLDMPLTKSARLSNPPLQLPPSASL